MSRHATESTRPPRTVPIGGQRSPLKESVRTTGALPAVASFSRESELQQLQRVHGNNWVSRLLADSARESGPPVQRVSIRQIQRWDGPEHFFLGDHAKGPQSGRILLDCHAKDLPERTRPVAQWPKEWQDRYNKGNPAQQKVLKDGLTYGEIVGLSGDLYADFAAMNRAPLSEIYELVPLIRDGASTGQLESASGGRYLTLAKENESHFSNVRPGHRNIDVWWKGHAQAIEAARNGNANLAWGLSAAADHFLTDAFSGGHIRVERYKLHQQGKSGDLKSKINHDLDNENGVEVTNARGDKPWIAYGDNFLEDKRNTTNLALALEAVQLSKQDIADALAKGKAYPAPKQGTVFAAERLVPHAINPSHDRWGKIDKGVEIAGLIKDELPEQIISIFKDDNRVRSWVAQRDLPAIGRQSVADRVRMIKVLLDGPTLDDDEHTILKVLAASAAAGDQVDVINQINAHRIEDDFNGSEEGKLQAFYRSSYYAKIDRATAFQLIWTCIDGSTAEWEESMIVDILAVNPASRVLVEDVGRKEGGKAKGPDKDFQNGMAELEDQLDGNDETRLHRLFPHR